MSNPAAARVSGFTPLLWALGMREGLSSAGKSVLIALASYADMQGSCFPSVARLANDTRLSERGCQRAITELEAGQFISVDRKTGRGHASVYRLALDRKEQTVKGDKVTPIKALQMVSSRHPFPSERVTPCRVKGDKVTPQLLIELPKAATRAKHAADQVKSTNIMPCLNDPPEAWAWLADKNPDGSPKTEDHPKAEPHHRGKPIVGGSYLDVAACDVLKAARMLDFEARIDWLPLITWLRDGVEPDLITSAIRRVASRPAYKPPRSLRYFDAAVRETGERDGRR